jgi:hypothetical protein
MNARSRTVVGAGFVLALSLFIRIPSARGQAAPGDKAAPMVGVKIYEYAGSFPDLFEKWRSLGVNTAFVSAALGANPEFKALSKENGVTTFLIFPAFFGGPELDKQPELYAVRADGARAEDDWVKFACPTREEYRAMKIEELRQAVRDVDPDVLSLDFMRFFVFWEKVYPDRKPDSLPNTCFDASCLAAFQKEMKVALPAGLPDTATRAKWILANQAVDQGQHPHGALAEGRFRRGRPCRRRPGLGAACAARRLHLADGLSPHGPTDPGVGAFGDAGRLRPDALPGPPQHPGGQGLHRGPLHARRVQAGPGRGFEAAVGRYRLLVLGRPEQVAGADGSGPGALRQGRGPLTSTRISP